MSNSTDSAKTGSSHVGDWLSGYLDGELTQQQQQRVALHLEQCKSCSSEYEAIRALRDRLGDSHMGEDNHDRWREVMDDTGVRLSRGVGWLLFLGSLLVLATIVLINFLNDPSTGMLMKVVISAFYLGWAALFVSVLRQRLIERKTDKYKDVEI